MNRTFLLTSSAVGTTVGVTIYYKEFLQGCHYDHTDDLRGKTAIITGANSGIGKETAKAFAKQGAKVVMACRDMNRCRAARKEIIFAARSSLDKFHEKDGKKRRAQVCCEELDLASLESVRKFADRMIGEQNITYLINNAATMRDPERVLTKDGFEKQMGVNHFGHFLLTDLLLQKLKESSPSRIVIVSSTAHYRGVIDFGNLNWDHDYSPGASYNASKLANVLFARELAKRVQNDGVVVSAVHPGLVNTEIFRSLPVMQSVSGYIFRPIMWLFLKSARAGAQTTLYAALSPDVEHMSGAYFSNCSEAKPSEKALDDERAARLWTVSEKWTRVQ